MRRMRPLAIVLILVAVAVCSQRPESRTESAAGRLSAAPAPAGKAVSFLQISGRWNIVASPETGDTTTTAFVLSATTREKGWTITFPHAKPIPSRVLLVAGDSFVIETGPYPSTRRPGAQATSRDVYHLAGSELTGTSVERSVAAGRDSVIRLRLQGSHAP